MLLQRPKYVLDSSSPFKSPLEFLRDDEPTVSSLFSFLRYINLLLLIQSFHLPVRFALDVI